MNIVQIHSGLGNQMFQYAFYLALKHNKPDTKIDTSVYAHRPSHNGYELEGLFNLRPAHATEAERDALADVSKDWFASLRRAMGFNRHTAGTLVTEPDPAEGWHEELLYSDNSYLQGYWQTEKYFRTVAGEVRDAFQFRLPLPPEEKAMAQQLQAGESVSVHIRRGDYLKKRRREDYEVCTADYYRRAVNYMQQHVESPVFYVFSDEPAWGEQQGIFPHGTTFVTGHTGQKAYLDMQLMSLCRHHIIANSSFSWWGAWLGQRDGTITIAPNRWFRLRKRPDIIPSNWTCIDAE